MSYRIIKNNKAICHRQSIQHFWVLSILVWAFCMGLSAQDNIGLQELALGDECYKQKRFDKAFEHYMKASETGNVQAQFLVGYAYYTGEGTARDFASAVTWFKRAAKKNYPKAQYNLAYCYMYGRGVPRNYDRAIELLTLSAENQLAQAQITLADCYERGILVEQDVQKANEWRKLAQQNSVTVKQSISTRMKGSTSAAVTSSPQTPVNVQSNEPKVIVGPNRLKEQEKAPEDEERKENIESQQKETTLSSSATNKCPVVKIHFPEDQSKFHTSTMDIRYQLTAYGEEKNTEVVVMVDGVVQKPSNSVSRSVRAAETVEVRLPDHDCVVTLYAKNKYGNSEPSSIRLIKENSLTQMPNLYVVAIGIGDYEDEKLPDLKFACKDANDFSKAIAKKRGLPYAEVEVKTLCDEEATREEIFEALEWLSQVSSPSNVCIFYYAGHGYVNEKDRFYFVPYGAHAEKRHECVDAQAFRDEANEIDGKFIVFLDACYSAALLGGNRSAVTDHFLEQLRSAKNGMMLYASSDSDTKSKENPEWQNGAYTHVLVEALSGAAKEEGDEGLSTDKLDRFLYNKVKEITHGTQKPIWVCPNGTQRFNLFIYDK